MPTNKSINHDIAGGGSGEGGGPSVNVVDNVTSTSVNDALSANQGRLLKDLSETKLSQSDVVDGFLDTYDYLPGSAKNDKELKGLVDQKQDAIEGSNADSIKSILSLNNVDNTSDMDKPVSSLQQSAIGAKVDRINLSVDGNLVIQNAQGGIQDSGQTILDLKDGWDGEVNTFADLPVASSNNGKKYVVKTPTGTTILGTKKYAGTYISDGAVWNIFGYKQASVINQTLSGFIADGSVSSIVSTDSILTSIQKVQNWFNTYFSNLTGDIQSQINNKEEKILAKSYVDAQVTDIKTVIDNWGSAAALTGYNYQLHANYSGADITINDYYNISFTGTDNPAGSPHTVFNNRSLTLTGSNCTRIKLININVENGLIVNGTQGRHYFEKCAFGGLTISYTSNWITFTDCTFSSGVTINSNFAGAVYFVRCSFGGQSMTLNNSLATQVILLDCSGLASIPSNAFKSGMTSLSSGVQSFYLNGTPFSSTNDFTDEFKNKLESIQNNATQNDTDENLKNRANHTGTQSHTTITGLGSASLLDVGTLEGKIPVLNSFNQIPENQIPNFKEIPAQNGINTFSLKTGNGQNNLESILGFYGTFYNYPADQGQRKTCDIRSGFNGGIWGTEFVSIGVGGATDSENICNEKIRINSNGNHGVNNATPSYAWHVNGSIAGTSYVTTSDLKLKENIKDIPIHLIDKILDIKIKSFNFIEDDKKIVQYGIIAQDLEKIEKELKNKNIETKLVNTDNYFEEFKNEDDLDSFLQKKSYLKATKHTNNNKFVAKWSQKAVNYNNLFIIQNSLIVDIISTLKTQNLFFVVDDIKEVYNNEYDNTYEVLTIQGDLIKSIEKNGNTQEKRIDVWVANGGKVIDKILSRQEILHLIKKENNRRIRLFGDRELTQNEWLQKSQNAQDVINRFTSQLVGKSLNLKIVGREITQKQYNDAIELIERKDAYVSHYHENLKPLINSMRDSEIISFNPLSDSLWKGLS